MFISALSPITDVDYPDSTLGTKKIEFNATVTNGAKLMVDMYIFKEDGNITMDGETTLVKKGELFYPIYILLFFGKELFKTIFNNTSRSIDLFQ